MKAPAWWGRGGALYLNSSQLSAVGNCERKWGFQYLDGEQEGLGNAFAQFGIVVHALMENWFLTGQHPADVRIDGEGNDPREVAESGLHQWPAPGEVDMVVEGSFHLEIDLGDGRAMYLRGTRDLVFWQDYGYHAGGVGVTLGDHKTTTDFRWAKTQDELRDDIQLNMYALATMVQWDVEEIDCKWVYYRTRGARKSEPRVITRTREECLEVLRRKAWPLYQRIIEIRARQAAGEVKHPRDLKPNVHHCSDYGGCPFRDQCGLRAIDRLKGMMAHVNLREKMMARVKKQESKEGYVGAPDDRIVGPTDPINPPEKERTAAPSGTPSKASSGFADPPPPKKATKAEKAPPSAPATVIEDEDEPSAGDAVEVAPARPATPIVGDFKKAIDILYVGCMPTDGAITLASEIIADAHRRVREGAEVPDYRLVEFGKGAGLLAAEVGELIEKYGRFTEVYIDPGTDEARATLQVFVERSYRVIRRT